MKNNDKKTKEKAKLNIGWLYPELMSTYGDRGNIIVLEKRCLWRKIDVKIIPLTPNSSDEDFLSVDMIIGGGSQDREQEIAIKSLMSKKSVIRKIFENGVPGLFVCGSPQLLGRKYIAGDSVVMEGLGIFEMETRHPGHDKPRCIGNTVANLITQNLSKFDEISTITTIVGFENHGGRTYLDSEAKPLAKVIVGNGNNGEDGSEGAVWHNCLAVYYHGPFLPKNVHVADWLIKTALEHKYQKSIKLEELNDDLEWQGHNFMLKKMNVV